METVIEINGLPVTFTDQKPTRSCACWRIKHEGRFTLGPYLTHVDRGLRTGRLVDNDGDGAPYIDDLFDDGWRFSAPLVPVTEVDRLKQEVEKAWFEGHSTATRNYVAEENIDREVSQDQSDRWDESNARKVVKGVQ